MPPRADAIKHHGLLLRAELTLQKVQRLVVPQLTDDVANATLNEPT